jgi:uncharacterized membrane protein YozB (DUF420 family)
MNYIYALPHLNATLNSISALLLITGYIFIRRRKIAAHRLCMLAAFTASVIFLISYLTYHWFHGSTPFKGAGWVRPVYFTILLTHTVLAVVVAPLAIVTLVRALSERFDKHRRIARWTFPVWLYVSVTGVIVYLMLYQMYPAR